MTTWTVSHRVLVCVGLLTGVTVALGATSFTRASAQQPPRPGGTSGLRPQTSLAQAVRVAEQQTGGRAQKAELEREKGVDVYEIKTVAKDGPAKVLVEPASGNVVSVHRPGVFSSISSVFDRKDQRKEQAALSRLEASPMTLVGAIEAAEKDSGGRSVKAALRSLYGSTFFEVTVVKDLSTQRLVVDPATGKAVVAPARGKHKDDDD